MTAMLSVPMATVMQMEKVMQMEMAMLAMPVMPVMLAMPVMLEMQAMPEMQEMPVMVTPAAMLVAMLAEMLLKNPPQAMETMVMEASSVLAPADLEVKAMAMVEKAE